MSKYYNDSQIKDLMNKEISLKLNKESYRKEIDYWRIQYSNLQEEIKRLNNIINEFERLLQQDLENEKDVYWTNITKEDYIQFMLGKLQELKGSDK